MPRRREHPRPATFRTYRDYELYDHGEMTPERIAAIRMSCGMLQPEFGALFGLTGAAVSQWERGISPPTGSARLLLVLVETEGPEAVVLPDRSLTMGCTAEHKYGSRDGREGAPEPEYGSREWAAQVRRDAGLRTEDLSILMGITEAGVRNWESRSQGPGGPALIILTLIEEYGLDHVVPGPSMGRSS